MSAIANFFWIIFGGFFTALSWLVAGLLLHITIIGIPLGRQCFKMAKLTLAPFGLEVTYGGGAPSFLANIVWLFLAGIPMAIEYICLGLLWCMTIVGIPIGMQLFKLAKFSLFPFGATIEQK